MHNLALCDNLLISLQSAFGVLFIGKNFVRLLGGLLVTIRIALVSVAFSLVLGFLLGVIMTIKNPIIKVITKVFLEFMRIMPQLVLLFIMYFGVTRAFGLSFSGEVTSVIVFTLWGTAEMGDLVRGAIASIPLHQTQSAKALGLMQWQIFLYIIIPQTIKQLVPLSMNLITRMIKTTSLVVFVGVIEVVKIGQQIIEASRLTRPYSAIGVYAVIFFLYFIVCWPLSFVASIIEKKQKKQGA